MGVIEGFECEDTDSASRCKVVCGDGIRVKEEQCDDGNTDDGDGCSSKCEIEQSSKLK